MLGRRGCGWLDLNDTWDYKFLREYRKLQGYMKTERSKTTTHHNETTLPIAGLDVCTITRPHFAMKGGSQSVNWATEAIDLVPRVINKPDLVSADPEEPFYALSDRLSAVAHVRVVAVSVVGRPAGIAN